MPALSPHPTLSLILGIVLLQGCNWVDSASPTQTQTQLDVGIPVAVVEFQTIAPQLVEDQAILLSEDTLYKSALSGRGSTAQNWQWELADTSDGTLCEVFEDYEQSLSATSLADACTNDEGCSIEFSEHQASQTAEFLIPTPPIKAPVALNFRLSTQTDDGQLIDRNQTLCLISINESPMAGNDEYVATPGEPLRVLAGDANSLLANDKDDDDVRNQPLRVNTSLVEKPKFADQFDIRSDGGFFYRAAADTPLDANGRQFDSFVYSITDGLHVVEASVTITLAAGNEPPQAVGSLPDAQVDIANNASPAYQIDVSPYFSDADNESLSYTIEAADLPEAVLIRINEQSVLTIDVDTQQGDVQTGTWQVDVTGSDGIASASTGFLLSLVNSQIENKAPTANDIPNRTVTGIFQYDVSVFFTDPEGDPLTFSSVSIPPDVQFSTDGVLSGISNSDNDGFWFITIKATDTKGNSVEDSFSLTIEK